MAGQTVDILVGAGSNIDPETHVRTLLRRFAAQVPDVRRSTFYWTRPLHNRRQNPYLNGVLAAATDRSIPELLGLLAELERAAGRRRDPNDAYASRTLDLDLLVYGDQPEPRYGLPADDLLERDFVLLPAAELLPDWRHPLENRTLAELAVERFPEPTTILRPADL